MAEEYPASTIPTVFADGVLNLAHGAGLAKFYLVRVDPSFTSPTENKVQAFAQVVMPMQGFLQTLLFFNKMLQEFVDAGVVSPEIYDRMHKVVFPEKSTK